MRNITTQSIRWYYITKETIFMYMNKRNNYYANEDTNYNSL